MKIYYNDNSKEACAWIRELIRDGLLPDGEVDHRSICDIQPGDVRGFDQCHFFAGIGGWPYALQLAHWEGPAWTGSCPCQPLSSAGQRKGHADERHLWPAFYNLIAECLPPTIFGEQVASKDGREWFAGVRADLEGVGYACGGADLCSAGVGSPHIRQRLHWLAYAEDPGREWSEATAGQRRRPVVESVGGIGGLDHSSSSRRSREKCGAERKARDDSRMRVFGSAKFTDRVAESECAQRGQIPERGDVVNGHDAGWEETAGGNGADSAALRLAHHRRDGRIEGSDQVRARKLISPWSSFDILPCLDGKSRRVESGTFPLAHGVPGRVGLLRGYGNAINPHLTALFVEAAREAMTI